MRESRPEVGPNLKEGECAQHGHEIYVDNEYYASPAGLMLRCDHVIRTVEREDYHYSICNTRGYNYRCLDVETCKGVTVRVYC